MLQTIKPKTRTKFDIGERVLDMENHRPCVVLEVKSPSLEGARPNYVIKAENSGPNDRPKTVPEVGLIPLRYNNI